MITLPVADRNKRGARFDPTACIKAINALGLKADVKVKWSQGKSRLGCHRWRDDEHHITISTYLDAERCSTTLWHELAHALQVERMGYDAYWETYKMYGRTGTQGYKTNPFEIEAGKFETEFHAALKLTKED